MMRGMKAILTRPFRAVAAPFRAISRFRARRKEKKFAKVARVTQERFERMVPSLQEEVKRSRSRFLDS